MTTAPLNKTPKNGIFRAITVDDQGTSWLLEANEDNHTLILDGINDTICLDLDVTQLIALSDLLRRQGY